MQRRHLPIAVVTGVLLLVALAGYLFPTSPEASPTRVLLENKGGKVIFTHADHTALGDQCGTCHHTTGGNTAPPPCKSCHVSRFDTAFAADHQTTLDESSCSVCHHAGAAITPFSHDEHAEDYAGGDCRACHHDESIESEPEACSNCHGQNQDGDTPALRQATHERCADCHDDFFKEGKNGCRRCHERKPESKGAATPEACSTCHDEPADQLIPTTSKAFHAQCMGCHEKENSGPFGDDACYQCHMK
ncbi:cytochrome C [Pseudodesulfovibrio cashew]|uniref:Cytochrome C n=1 Tax=Pseudodesulfovibrio cashew TaxID=2678688 RepID=A0A6I6JWD1_9BACT|nr:cytochrome C [Pseudodesulfovibrio cashew]